MMLLPMTTAAQLSLVARGHRHADGSNSMMKLVVTHPARNPTVVRRSLQSHMDQSASTQRTTLRPTAAAAVPVEQSENVCSVSDQAPIQTHTRCHVHQLTVDGDATLLLIARSGDSLDESVPNSGGLELSESDCTGIGRMTLSRQTDMTRTRRCTLEQPQSALSPRACCRFVSSSELSLAQ
jgi:hypothetical protein